MEMSKFSPEILKLIEQEKLEEASKLAHHEIIQIWKQQQEEKLKITRGWLKQYDRN